MTEQTPCLGGISTLLILFTLFTLFATELTAQAWTKDSGQVYVKLAYGSSTASEQYSFDGTAKQYADNVNENAFFDRSIYLYTELGLLPGTTMVVGLPYKRVIVRDAAFRYRTFSFGDLQLGVRQSLNEYAGLTHTPYSLAANLSASIPTGYTRNFAPSAGSGQINLEAGLGVGRSLYPFPGYLQADLGYRYRSSLFFGSTTTPCQEGIDRNCFEASEPSYGDELLARFEAGVTIDELVFLQGLFHTTWSIATPETGFTVSNPIPTRQRFTKIGLGSALLLPANFSVNAQLFTTIAGRNSVKSLDLFLGIDYTFQAF